MILSKWHVFLSKIANQFIYLLFINLFVFIFLLIHLILVKHFYRFILTCNTFEDVILPLAVEMYIITCFLHLLSCTIYETHAKTGQNQMKLI